MKWLPLILALAAIITVPYLKTIWGDIPNATC